VEGGLYKCRGAGWRINVKRESDAALYLNACHESGPHWTLHILPDNPVARLTSPTKNSPEAPKSISFPNIETAASSTPVAETPAASIKFENKSSTTVKVIWVDYQGQEKLYQSLGPSDSYVQPTYCGHVWLVKTEDGVEVGRFAATADSKLFVVSILERGT
jgi:hypothetical protein